MKEEMVAGAYGIETRYPFLDRDVVQEFLWLKPMDRRLWYMLNCVGRQTPYSEAGGPFAHWRAEKVMGRRCLVPMIDEAIKGLEIAIRQVKQTPEQMQEKVDSIGYTDGGIEQDDFDYIMRSLVPGDTLTVESKRFLSGFFSKIRSSEKPLTRVSNSSLTKASFSYSIDQTWEGKILIWVPSVCCNL